MQVVAGAVAGAAYITYNLPCRYRFTCGNGSLRHMGVPRGKSSAVIQQHLIAVAVVPAADQHRAAVGSQDVCALWRGNVSAAMPGIASGWHHIYLGAGNHLLVRDCIYPEFEKTASAYFIMFLWLFLVVQFSDL